MIQNLTPVNSLNTVSMISNNESFNSMEKLAPSPLNKRTPVFHNNISPPIIELSENIILGHRPSRLDLIDNTTLTSFPLAHPRPATINQCHLRNVSKVEVSSTPHQNSSMILYEPDHQSPLVLIEDYIEEPMSESRTPILQNNQKLQKPKNMKRISLMNLKKKFHNTTNMETNVNAVDITLAQANVLDRLSVFSEELSSVRSIISGKAKRPSELSGILLPQTSGFDEMFDSGPSSSFPDMRKQMLDLSVSPILLQRQCSKMSKTSSSVFTNQCEDELNVRSLFGTEHSSIRDERVSMTGSANNTALSSTSSPLKYCVLCEKPLYDISSLIPEDKKCEEIVCSDCFEPYNKVISIIRNQDTTNTTREEFQELMRTVCSNRDRLVGINNEEYSDYDYTDTTIEDIEEASNTLATILIRSSKSMEFGNKNDTKTLGTELTRENNYVFEQLIKSLKLIQARDIKANELRYKKLHTKQSIFDISNMFKEHLVNHSYENFSGSGRESQEEHLNTLNRILRLLRLK